MDFIKEIEELKKQNEIKQSEAQKNIDKANEAIKLANEQLAESKEQSEKLAEAERIAKERKELDEKMENIFNSITGKNNAVETKETKKESSKGLIAGLLIFTTLISGAAGYSLCKSEKAGTFKLFGNNINNNNNNNNNSVLGYDYDNNVVLLNTEDQEKLTTDEFNKLTEKLIKDLRDKKLNISDGDVEKFMMLVHIDKLAETNFDLIKKIMGNQNADEVQQDAYKVIGEIVMYNYNTYYTENKTDNFIRISEYVFGTKSKDVVAKVENRIDEISKAKDNKELNYLITNLLRDLLNPTSELSYTEDGIGYALQASLEPVRGLFGMDLYGKNLLDKTNKDLIKYFVPYAGDEQEYVDNNVLNGHILNIHDILTKCQTNNKTLVK